MQEIKETFSLLVQDTLSLLKQQEGYLLTSKENTLFFREDQIKKSVSKPIEAVTQTVLPPPPPALKKERSKESSPEQIKVEQKKVPEQEKPKSVDSIKERLARLAPHMKVIEEVPDDASAKRVAQQWKEQSLAAGSVILVFGQTGPELSFLKQLAKAIDIHFLPTKLIHGERLEREKKWDIFLGSQDLKWVFVLEKDLHSFPELLRYYKEIPSKSERYLGDVPLFLLPPLSTLFKEPSKKQLLWDTLCQALKQI